MRRSNWLRLAFVAALAIAFSATASAQFFIRATIDSIDPFVCSVNGFNTTAAGTLSFHLPNPPDNQISTLFLNGSLETTEFSSVSPPDNSVSGNITVSVSLLAPTPLPYTIRAEVFPAQGGNPVGQGLRLLANCPASGPGTLVFQNVGGVAPAVPTAMPEGLAVMSVLLALSGLLLARRRRGSRPT